MKKNKNDRSVPYAHTRSHHANETAEDYVEAVGDIIEEIGRCRVQDLANHFNVSHVTVSRIVGRLQNEALLETAPYQPITLTRKGQRLAEKVRKRHAVVFEFLVALGVDQRTAEIDSEGIEHHVSEKTLTAMKRFIKSQGT